ncbi:MAG: toll/interleukin-1 receptor domain-containing protein [Anaerolineales bacterium]|nr:toll/interleukin-1 receptor domain-containing protein [Anaerolineales bacterium]
MTETASIGLLLAIGVVIGIIIIVFVLRRRGSQKRSSTAQTRYQPDASSPQPEPRPKVTRPRQVEQQRPAQGNINIFLSYRREDSADVTGRIYDRLVQHFGQPSIFKDVDSIPLGVDFRSHLDMMVGKCQIFIVVIGDRWLDEINAEGEIRLSDPRDFVRIEIESALKRGIPVIPVLVSGATMPPEEILPASLRDLSYRNAILVRPDPDFHRDMDRLIAGLETHLNG